MDMNAHHASLQQTLKGIESKLAFLGPGGEEYKKLTAVKQTILQQMQASIQTSSSQQQQMVNSTVTGTPQQQQQPSESITSRVASPAVSVPIATLAQKSNHAQVVLTKPKPPPPMQTHIPQAAVKPETKILNRQRLQDLVKEIDPSEQLDEDVEEMLIAITDDFIENVVSSSCQLARHRKSNTLEVKDVKLHLEKHWNLTIPGYGSDEVRSYKKPATSDAHKQRLALIRKAMKK